MKVTILAAILASFAVALPLLEQEQGQAFTQVYQDQNTGLYYEFDDETQQYFQVDPASLDFYPADEEAAANFQAAVEAEGQQQEYEEANYNNVEASDFADEEQSFAAGEEQASATGAEQEFATDAPQQEAPEQQFVDVYQDQNTGLYYEFDDEAQQYFQVDPASLDFYPADEEAAANFQAAVEAEEQEYDNSAQVEEQEFEETRVPEAAAAFAGPHPSFAGPHPAPFTPASLESLPRRRHHGRYSYPSLRALRRGLRLGPRWTLSQISNHMATVGAYSRRIVGLTEELKGFMSNRYLPSRTFICLFRISNFFSICMISPKEFAEKYPKAAKRIRKHRKARKAHKAHKEEKSDDEHDDSAVIEELI